MFKRIVVPLDGTPFSEAALAPASALARAFDASIVLVRAVAAYNPSRATLDAADSYLHRAIAKLRAEHLVTGIDLYAASPGASIASAAQLEHADLIVMTAHPRWKLDLLDDTSTTLQVLAQSDVPILAWRATDDAGDQAATATDAHLTLLGRTECPIIVPLDGTLAAEAAIPVAEALVRRFGSYLLLVRAIAQKQDPAAPERLGPETPYRYLKRVQRRVQQRGVGAIVAVYRGRPEHAVDQACREHDASLVVMASRRHVRGGTGLLDSIAVRIVEELTVPVLIVRSNPIARTGKRGSSAKAGGACLAESSSH